MKKETLREKFADLEHQQWSHWTEYMLENLYLENRERWKVQLRTPYKDLSEKEKDGDREWADKVLKVFDEWKKQFIKEILEEIENRRKNHKKHFDRYVRETEKYSNDKRQVEYSEAGAIKEMYIDDSLKEIEDFIKQKLGEELLK